MQRSPLPQDPDQPEPAPDAEQETPTPLEEVVRTEHDFIRKVACESGTPAFDADDVVQLVYESLIQHPERIPPRSWLRSWLHVVTSRKARDFLDKRATRRKYEAPSDTGEVDPDWCAPSGEDLMITEQTKKAIGDLIDQLPANRRETLLRFDIQGDDMPEIAASRGVRLTTAYNFLRLAREELKARCIRRWAADEHKPGGRSFALMPLLVLAWQQLSWPRPWPRPWQRPWPRPWQRPWQRPWPRPWPRLGARDFAGKPLAGKQLSLNQQAWNQRAWNQLASAIRRLWAHLRPISLAPVGTATVAVVIALSPAATPLPHEPTAHLDSTTPALVQAPPHALLVPDKEPQQDTTAPVHPPEKTLFTLPVAPRRDAPAAPRLGSTHRSGKRAAHRAAAWASLQRAENAASEGDWSSAREQLRAYDRQAPDNPFASLRSALAAMLNQAPQ